MIKVENYELKQLAPRVWSITCASQHELAMLFLRYQEYYESPEFQGKIFTIAEYASWYAETHDGKFSYPQDWSGFNIPSRAITDVIWGVDDKNEYDRIMYSFYSQVTITESSTDFYLIGVQADNGALDHEIAHALYFINPGYKSECQRLTKLLGPVVTTEIYNYLATLGYAGSVLDDELQAWLSTGPNTEEFDLAFKQHAAPFVANFNNFRSS